MKVQFLVQQIWNKTCWGAVKLNGNVLYVQLTCQLQLNFNFFSGKLLPYFQCMHDFYTLVINIKCAKGKKNRIVIVAGTPLMEGCICAIFLSVNYCIQLIILGKCTCHVNLQISLIVDQAPRVTMYIHACRKHVLQIILRSILLAHLSKGPSEIFYQNQSAFCPHCLRRKF